MDRIDRVALTFVCQKLHQKIVLLLQNVVALDGMHLTTFSAYLVDRVEAAARVQDQLAHLVITMLRAVFFRFGDDDQGCSHDGNHEIVASLLRGNGGKETQQIRELLADRRSITFAFNAIKRPQSIPIPTKVMNAA